MAVKLDKINLGLLSELDKNSRLPITKMAKKLRISQATTNFRLKRLIDEEIILGFYPSIDLSKLGLFAFRVYIQLKNTTPELEKAIIQSLVKENSCTIVARLESVYDIMFAFTTSSNSEFYKFWYDFKKRYRKYINKEHISIFHKVEHFKRRYLSNSADDNPEIVGISEPLKLDKEDKKILLILAKDCRTSAVDIATETNIPARTVVYKIRQLEKKKIIVGYRINLNLNKLGYEYYKLNCKLESYDKLESLLTFIRSNKNLVFIDHTISDFDLEIEIEIENKSKLKEFIGRLKEKFPIFKEIEILSFSRYYKIETISL